MAKDIERIYGKERLLVVIATASIDVPDGRIYAVRRPVLSTRDWIRAKLDDGCRFVSQQKLPIDGVIPTKWRSSVIDRNGRVYRISYELYLLKQLRECIRSKEIWWSGLIAIATEAGSTT